MKQTTNTFSCWPHFFFMSFIAPFKGQNEHIKRRSTEHKHKTQKLKLGSHVTNTKYCLHKTQCRIWVSYRSAVRSARWALAERPLALFLDGNARESGWGAKHNGFPIWRCTPLSSYRVQSFGFNPLYLHFQWNCLRQTVAIHFSMQNTELSRDLGRVLGRGYVTVYL